MRDGSEFVHLELSDLARALRQTDGPWPAGIGLRTAELPADLPLIAETTAFTNTTVGEPPLTFEWNLGDGTDIVTTTHPAHTYGQVGLYTVLLTATNSYGPATCSGTVSIEGPPVAHFESILLGQPAIFRNTSIVNPPATARVWSFGDGGTSTEENPIHTYAAVGSYRVTLVAVNGRGTDSYQSTVRVVRALIYLPLVVKNAGP